MIYKIFRIGLYVLLGIGMIGVAATIGILIARFHNSGGSLYHSGKKFFRRIINGLFPSTIPSWKIAMQVFHPNLGRPRSLSLHTIATITGRSDLLQLAKEMRKSCEVNVTFCGTVRAPVFYLRRYSGPQGHGHGDIIWWDKLDEFLKQYPYPAIKGFCAAEEDGSWTGRRYGVGTYMPPKTEMSEPFIKDDYIYANKIVDALRKWKRQPGIEKYKIKPVIWSANGYERPEMY